MILQGRLSILTGKVDSGKSTFLASLITFIRKAFPPVKVGGILCRGIFQDSAKVGYKLEELHSGERYPFAIRGRSLEDNREDPDGVSPPPFLQREESEELRAGKYIWAGQWLILQSALDRGEKSILTAVQGDYDLVVIDEFGKLELQGQGFRAATDELAHAGKAGILVAREEILEEVQRFYNPYITHVVPVP